MTIHVSIHDVMPETLPEVREILAYLSDRGIDRTTLLVVPGKAWSDDALQTLRDWQQAGHELAGHGWHHRVERRETLYHKVHGLVISRFVAEHLSLSANEIADLISRCHRWFGENGLQAPSLYVPPAWAMGRISRKALRRLPFDAYETLRGVYRAREDRFVPSPVVGFEADTFFRQQALRTTNGIARRIASHRGACRLALHPHDLHLRLRKDIDRWFSRPSVLPNAQSSCSPTSV